MTLITRKFRKNLTLFCRKNWENILTYFDTFQLKFLDFGQKTADFTRFLKNWKKNKICQNRKFGSFFFFVVLFTFVSNKFGYSTLLNNHVFKYVSYPWSLFGEEPFPTCGSNFQRNGMTLPVTVHMWCLFLSSQPYVWWPTRYWKWHR